MEGGLQARPSGCTTPVMAGGAGRTTISSSIDRLAELLGLQVALFHPTARREGTLRLAGTRRKRFPQGTPAIQFVASHWPMRSAMRFCTVPVVDWRSYLESAAVLPSQDLIIPEMPTDAKSAILTLPRVPGEEILRPGEAYSARADAFAASLLPEDRLLTRYLNRGRQNTAAVGGSKRGAITKKLAREFGVSEDVVLRSLRHRELCLHRI